MSSAAASGDSSWADEVVLTADRKWRNTLLAAGAAILCALGLGVYAYAMGGSEAKTAEAAEKAFAESHTDTAVASPDAEPLQAVEAVAAQTSALSAHQISGAPKLGDEPPAVAPSPTKLSKKALRRKRARARRARLAARAH